MLSRITTTCYCCRRRFRVTNSLMAVSLGILALLWMEFHLHRRFLADIFFEQQHDQSSQLLLPQPSHKKHPLSEQQNTSSFSSRPIIRINNNKNDSSSSIQKLVLTKKPTPQATDTAIFYNVFLNPANATNGIRIIEEHTRQIARSDFHRHTPVYYNIIGYNYTQRFCPQSLQCHLLHYYPTGGEDKTLQDLFEYCQQHRSHNVIYLHNKGSFSPNRQNEIKRKGVTNTLLRRRHLKGKACNVLAHTWEPLPHSHAQGNMWLAKCSYVARLIPPNQYEQRRVEMFRELLRPPPSPPPLNDTTTTTLTTTKNNKDKSKNIMPYDKYECLTMLFNRSHPDIYLQDEGIIRAVAMGRYRHELWVYSHPRLHPCDSDYTLGRPILQRFDATSKRFRRAWLRQPGRLWEYQYLYHQLPPNTSYFWDYFADAAGVRWPKYCRKDPTILSLMRPSP